MLTIRRSLEDEYSQIEEKLSTFDTDLKELKRQLPNDDKRIEEKKAALIQNVNEMRRLEKEIKDLKAIEYHEHSNEMASLVRLDGSMERSVQEDFKAFDITYIAFATFFQ